MTETLLGFIALIISCVAFGFMFAPLRNFDRQDGFYIQWIQCAVVCVVGFIINCSTGFPDFNPIAMIGGFLFATVELQILMDDCNIASVPVINGLGIGVGMLIWGSIQVLVGWSVARFGLFGTHPQPVYNNLMNVIGLALTLLSGFMFVFVKHDSQHSVSDTGESTNNKLDDVVESQMEMENPMQQSGKRIFFKISKNKLTCLGLSLLLGIFHGLMLTPIVYIQDNFPDGHKSVLDYLFAHFSTVFTFSSVYFAAYCIYKRGKPHAPPELILPSIAYGMLWCIGMVLFFVSNRLLSQTVSFPITTRLPSTIGVLADVLLFRTIKGKNNLLYAFSAVLIGLVGVMLIAFSNQQF